MFQAHRSENTICTLYVPWNWKVEVRFVNNLQPLPRLYPGAHAFLDDRKHEHSVIFHTQFPFKANEV